MNIFVCPTPSVALLFAPDFPSCDNLIIQQTVSDDYLSACADLVGLSGLEPPTSRLSGARSNLLSYKPIWCDSIPSPSHFSFGKMLGGDDGIRTHDPLLAGQVLSQLSYTPIWCMFCCFQRTIIMILQNRTTTTTIREISSSLVIKSISNMQST